jgi:hypothetical protein
LTKFPTPIQLQPETMANDIIDQFRRRTIDYDSPTTKVTNGRRGSSGDELAEPTKLSKETISKVENMYLYEIGGNIGERKLDRDTNMLALLNVNPNADWVIRIQVP